MMTSENSLEQVYARIWLHGATEPVVAGVLSRDNGRFIFNYGRSYLERKEAIAVYVPELPLVRGAIVPAWFCKWLARYAMELLMHGGGELF